MFGHGVHRGQTGHVQYHAFVFTFTGSWCGRGVRKIAYTICNLHIIILNPNLRIDRCVIMLVPPSTGYPQVCRMHTQSNRTNTMRCAQLPRNSGRLAITNAKWKTQTTIGNRFIVLQPCCLFTNMSHITSEPTDRSMRQQNASQITIPL